MLTAVAIILLLALVVWSSVPGDRLFAPPTEHPAAPWLAAAMPPDSPTRTAPLIQPIDELKPATLNELLALPADELHRVDIARMNLLCAVGLPGTEGLDIEHSLATLDQWAQRVAQETQRHLYRATDPRYAAHYRHSEAYLRAEFLMQVLGEDLGVRYNASLADDMNWSFADSSRVFIHGMIPAPGQSINHTPGGTCSSMPVLAMAIGHRLGYPLHLVTTNKHLFLRWEGEHHPDPSMRGRFNVESTSTTGFLSPSDEDFKAEPFHITDADAARNGYLQSMSHREAFAQFLAGRGHAGVDNYQFSFAARSYENAHRYDPSRPCYSSWFLHAANASGYQSQTASLARIQDNERMREVMMARSVRPMGGLPMPSRAGRPSRPGDIVIDAHGRPMAPTTQSVFSTHPTPRNSPPGTHP